MPSTRKPALRVGVFGGSFNPVHLGHLVVAEEARVRLRLDRVLFVVAADPPHKRKATLAPAADRYDLVRLAIAENPAFEACDAEMSRPGPSYTVETLAALHAAWGRGTRFFLIVGQDSVADMPGWREPRKVLRLAELVVAGRAGYDPASLDALLPLMPRKARPVVLQTRVVVSATEIRERLARGESARYLVPDAVLGAIARRGLYGTGA